MRCETVDLPLTKEQMSDAMRSEATAEREQIDLTDLSAMSAQNISELEAILDKELLLSALAARKTADLFFELTNEERESRKESGTLFTRVRVLNNSLQATWNTGTYTLKDGSGNSRFIARHISKRSGRGKDPHRYPKSAFKGAPDWEKEIAEETELRYAHERRKAEVIGQIRRLVKKYRRLCDSDDS